MKKFALKTLALLAFLSVGFISCDDDETGRIETKTIAQIAADNASFSTLVQALNRAGLVNVLNSPGSFTVFAPTNDAFSAFLSSAGFASVNDVPVPVLTQILLNHVVAGTVQSSQLSTGYVKTEATFNGVENGSKLSLYVTTSNGVRLNGVSTVTMPNILASNGIVHVVDAVIGLPTVVTFAAADPNFSTLVSALTTLTPATDFAAILSRTAGGNTDGINPPFTVFAPTNTAFAALPAVPAEPVLTQVLLHHVIGGANVLSTGLVPNGNTTPTMLNGTNITITLPGTGGNIANVTDGAGNTGAGIIAVDVQAANGVIHVLNKVLLP